jgi:hypothetical protein
VLKTRNKAYTNTLATIKPKMRILIIFTSILLLFSCNSNAQKMNCEKFKNGEFKILKDSIAEESLISRIGNLQTEKIAGQKGTTELIVNWIDKCTYTLKPKDMSLEKFKGLPKNALLKVEIIEIKENSYIQKTTANFAEFELISELHKIK